MVRRLTKGPKMKLWMVYRDHVYRVSYEGDVYVKECITLHRTRESAEKAHAEGSKRDDGWRNLSWHIAEMNAE